MSLKKFKATTPTRRHTVLIDHKDTVTKKRPTRKLLRILKSKGGRNNQGKLTMRHQGGGVKKFYRMIDFNNSIKDIKGTVKAIEYDPNRSSYITLIAYEGGTKVYRLAWSGCKVGQIIESGEKAEIKDGNSLPLVHIPAGTLVNSIEVNAGSGAKLVRSAGQVASLQGLNGKGYAQIKLPSGEVRLINENCYATIGTVSNSEHINEKVGSAGRNRRRGIRPSVRGMVMPPSAHPHGGGEAKGVIGGPSQDVYGNYRGLKTRKKKKISTKFIISRRKNKKSNK